MDCDCLLPSAPIGVFDSGVGGLSVLHEIRRVLPAEDLDYIADSGHVPYGNKPPAFILERSRRLAKFLIDRGSKALVIACNTATASAAATLRLELPHIPILAMEPAVKPAVAATKSNVVGVLATVGTLKSAQFAALLDKFAQEVTVVTQGCPGLVECVESGQLNSPETRTLVASYVRPLLNRGADTIVLGCTHYPFLRAAIQAAAGPDVSIIDTGRAVARHLQTRLQGSGLLNPSAPPGHETFYTTADAAAAAPIFGILWEEGAAPTFCAA